jgi:hypothetical protein
MSIACEFFYEDSHRRSPKRECRLIQRSPASEPWHDRLCGKCPVPEILETDPCASLALEAEVISRWRLFPRVSVFAVCTVKLEQIRDATGCREGCAQFETLL